MGTGISGIVYVLDVLLDEGVGASDTFLVERMLTPFILDDSDIVLETLLVIGIVQILSHISPLTDPGRIICVFVSK